MKCKTCGKEFNGNYCPICGTKNDCNISSNTDFPTVTTQIPPQGNVCQQSDPIPSADSSQKNTASDHKTVPQTVSGKYNFCSGWNGCKWPLSSVTRTSVTIKDGILKSTATKSYGSADEKEIEISSITTIKRGLFYSALLVIGEYLAAFFALCLPDYLFILFALYILFLILCKNNRMEIISPNQKIVIDSFSRKKADVFLSDLCKHYDFHGTITTKTSKVKFILLIFSAIIMLFALFQ